MGRDRRYAGMERERMYTEMERERMYNEMERERMYPGMMDPERARFAREEALYDERYLEGSSRRRFGPPPGDPYLMYGPEYGRRYEDYVYGYEDPRDCRRGRHGHRGRRGFGRGGFGGGGGGLGIGGLLLAEKLF